METDDTPGGSLSSIAWAAIGLGAAIVTVLVAFMLAAAGEGWGSPFFASLGLVVIYPLATSRLGVRTEAGIGVDIALLVVALLADAWVIDATLGDFSDAQRIFSSYPAVAAFWIVLWTGWQLAVVAALALRTLRR